MLSNVRKQLAIVVFNQTLLKLEGIVHLLGTIFSGGSIHTYCTSEYLVQQDGLCGIESK